MDVWRIQALGRWGSEAVRGYLRGAHLSSLVSLSAEANLGRSLEASRAELLALQVKARQIRDQLSAVVEKEEAALESAPVHGLLPLTASDVLDGDTVAEETFAPPPSAAVSEIPFVRNSKAGGLLHVVQFCPPDRPYHWTSICGWKFGRQVAQAVRTADRDCAEHCPRCFKSFLSISSTSVPVDSVPDSSKPGGLTAECERIASGHKNSSSSESSSSSDD